MFYGCSEKNGRTKQRRHVDMDPNVIAGHDGYRRTGETYKNNRRTTDRELRHMHGPKKGGESDEIRVAWDQFIRSGKASRGASASSSTLGRHHLASIYDRG